MKNEIELNKIAFCIICNKEYQNENYQQWASKWLNGEDRTSASAYSITKDIYSNSIASGIANTDAFFAASASEMAAKHAEFLEKTNEMSKIIYSPGYMPIDKSERLIWAILIEIGYADPLKILEYIPEKSITTETIKNGRVITQKIDISWAFQDKPDYFKKIKEVQKELDKEISRSKVP